MHKSSIMVSLLISTIYVSDKNCADVICPEEAEKCPEDSYRLPAYKSVEDCCLTTQSCQCLPKVECKPTECPRGHHARIVRPGNGKPGTCCPLYDCVADQSKLFIFFLHHLITASLDSLVKFSKLLNTLKSRAPRKFEFKTSLYNFIHSIQFV